MSDYDGVSHGDIYHKLGVMEGKLESVILQLSQKRDDVSGVFTRLRYLETRVAVGLGVTLCLAFIVPIIVTAAAPKVLLQQESVVERKS